MAHVLPITFAGAGEKFLKRLNAVPGLLDHATRHLSGLRLDAAWRGTREIQVFEDARQGRISSCYDPARDTLQLYPLLFGRRPDADLYEAFGRRRWHQLDRAAQLRWINANVLPDPAVLARFRDAVAAGTPYREILRKVRGAPDRLAVIHLVNALLKNHTPVEQARMLDLDHYPPTADFMSGGVCYSLVPVLRALRPGHLAKESYAAAFSEYCVNRGKFLGSDASVVKAYGQLFRAVTFP